MAVDPGFAPTEEEVRRRKSYLEITPEDEARLREAHPAIEAQAGQIIARFYEYLLSHEHTRHLLEPPGRIEHLKKLQLQYFRELTSGRYDLDYFANRMRVGEAHHRVGLSPEWYVGAYLKYLHIVTDVLSASFAGDRQRFSDTLVSLTKVIYLDMGLALEVYHHKAQLELRRTAQVLEASNAQLRQLQASKRLLSDMIVHDLQSPLAGIQAFLQILQARCRGEPREVQEAIAEGLRRSSDLSQMILNVLHISRSEMGRLEASMEDVDVARLVSEVAASHRLLFEQAGRELSVDAPRLLVIRTDSYLLRRIVENLLRNTLRHTPEGTPVTVRIAAAGPGGARLSVIDTGRGIPLELQHLLFSPFGAPELRSAGLKVDTGLGLAFCGVATEAIGAQIQVESDGRSGTAVHIVFPARGTPA